MIKKSSLLFVFFLLFSACASHSSPSNSSAKNSHKKSSKHHKNTPKQIENDDSIEDLIYTQLSGQQQEILKKYKSHKSAVVSLAGSKFDIPVTVNSRVQKWIDYFAYGSGRSYFARWLARSTRFAPLELKILKEHKVPKDIIFLSMIESGFNTHAYSSASASGLWQFIRSTGRLYGLESNYWIDERRDPEKASIAAARHLRDLYEEFGDWYLAFGAYNSGAGRIKKAISSAGSRDFWDLADSKYLPQETKDYVPKIIAAAIIGKAPEKYGFTDIEYQDYIPIEKVSLSTPTDIEVIADVAGISVDFIRLINPELKRSLTPPFEANYQIKLPKSVKSIFEAKFARLSAVEKMGNSRFVIDEDMSAKSLAAVSGVNIKQIWAANPSFDGHNHFAKGTVILLPKSFDGPPSMNNIQLASSSKKRLPDLIAGLNGNEKAESNLSDKNSKKDKKKKQNEEKTISSNPDSYSASASQLLFETNKDKASSHSDKSDKIDLTQLGIEASKKQQKNTEDNPIATTPATPSVQENPAPLNAGSTNNSAISEDDTEKKILEALGKVSSSDNKNTGGAEEATNNSTTVNTQNNQTLRIKASGEDNTELSDKTIPLHSSKASAQLTKSKKNNSPKKIAYTVKKGDALIELAERFDVEVADIKKWNHLKRSELLKGEKLTLYIEKDERSVEKIAEKNDKKQNKKIAAQNKKKEKIVTYKVKKGDTLEKISRKYDINVSEIKNYNKIKKSTIQPGLVIRIPKVKES